MVVVTALDLLGGRAQFVDAGRSGSGLVHRVGGSVPGAFGIWAISWMVADISSAAVATVFMLMEASSMAADTIHVAADLPGRGIDRAGHVGGLGRIAGHRGNGRKFRGRGGQGLGGGW